MPLTINEAAFESCHENSAIQTALQEALVLSMKVRITWGGEFQGMLS